MMKIKISITIMLIFLIFLTITNIAYAVGNFSVSGGGNIDINKNTSISITTSNCAGKFSVVSSNSNVASVSSSEIFVDGSNSVNITGKAAGTATITIKAEDVTDTDENPVTGQKTVTVTVKEPTPPPTQEPERKPDPTPTPEPKQPTQPANPGVTVTTKSSDANLKNLGITPNDFTGFRKNITTYSHEVPNEVDKVNVYAEVANSKAKIISGTGTKNLVVGSNKLNVVVAAEDGTEKTYIINLTRKEKKEEIENPEKEKPEEEIPVVQEIIGLSSLTVQGLKLNPTFDSKVYSYNVDLTKDLEKLEIKTEGTLENSKIEITGNEDLKDGENVITIIVTNDKTEEIATYQIIVNKKVETVVGNTDNNKKSEPEEAQSIPKIYLILSAIIVVAIILLLIVLKSGKNKEPKEEDFNEETDKLESNNTEYEEFIPQNSSNPFDEQQIDNSNDFNIDNKVNNNTVESIFGKKGKHS